MYEWVGLRPGRDTLRIELEKKTINGKPLTVRHFLVIVLTACCESPQSFSFWQVIQNYGHGGSGNDQTEDVNAFKRLTWKYFNGYIGLTTFYGCALKVANLLQGTLASEHYLSSKLWYNQEEKRCPAFLNKALWVFYVIRVFFRFIGRSLCWEYLTLGPFTSKLVLLALDIINSLRDEKKEFFFCLATW